MTGLRINRNIIMRCSDDKLGEYMFRLIFTYNFIEKTQEHSIMLTSCQNRKFNILRINKWANHMKFAM